MWWHDCMRRRTSQASFSGICTTLDNPTSVRFHFGSYPLLPKLLKSTRSIQRWKYVKCIWRLSFSYILLWMNTHTAICINRLAIEEHPVPVLMYSTKHDYPKLANKAALLTVGTSSTTFMEEARKFGLNDNHAYQWV